MSTLRWLASLALVPFALACGGDDGEGGEGGSGGTGGTGAGGDGGAGGVSVGTVQCTVKNETPEPECTFERDMCSDGNTYAVSCQGETCTCQLGGSPVANYTGQSPCSIGDPAGKVQFVNEQCGWDLAN